MPLLLASNIQMPDSNAERRSPLDWLTFFRQLGWGRRGSEFYAQRLKRDRLKNALRHAHQIAGHHSDLWRLRKLLQRAHARALD
jgi:hypothetical protein